MPLSGKQPMPVKHWSFAGLLLTYWCNARCACCYLGCDSRPNGREGAPAEMTVEQALTIWRQLVAASPHGCRVHLTGGEAFGDWPRLIELCRRARAEGLGPLEKVETNAFWAAADALIRQRVRDLDEAGMETLAISADPYHQQFVPIAHCRRLAEVAANILGPERVQVRWRDWLEEGFDTAAIPPDERRELFLAYLRKGRERLNGRAARELAPHMLLKPLSELVDKPCREFLLRGRHVHVDPYGVVMPGTCAGLSLGRLGPDSTVEQLWRQLNSEYEERPVLGVLARSGPVGLLEKAREMGFTPQCGYAGKCHLCWEIRTFLSRSGDFARELQPAWMYL